MAKTASYNICDHDKPARDETSYSSRYSVSLGRFSKCCDFSLSVRKSFFSLRKPRTTIIECFGNGCSIGNPHFVIDTFHCTDIKQFLAKGYFHEIL